MTERDYAIRSFKEITLNAARHTEERMDLYYEKMKALMNNYQDLILENQMVLDELEQECQEKINENMAYALQYMDAYDYRMNLGKLKKEVNNIILIYGLCDMVNRAMTLVKYFTPNVGSEYYDVLYGCFCRHRKMTDMEIMLELGMSRASFYRKLQRQHDNARRRGLYRVHNGGGWRRVDPAAGESRLRGGRMHLRPLWRGGQIRQLGGNGGRKRAPNDAADSIMQRSCER